MSKILFLFVNYKTEKLINLNIDLILSQNKDININFDVIDNSISFKNTSNSSKIKIHKNLLGKNRNIRVDYIGSIQHSQSINNYIKKNKSNIKKFEFICIIDPDFFIFSKNWINILLSHLVNKNLDFISSGYHPKYLDLGKSKNYDFSVFFFLIKTKSFHASKLDFLPKNLSLFKNGNFIYDQYKSQIILNSSKLIRTIFAINDIIRLKSSDVGSSINLKKTKYKVFNRIIENTILIKNIKNTYLEKFKVNLSKKNLLFKKNIDQLVSNKIFRKIIRENSNFEFYKIDNIYAIHCRGYFNSIKIEKIIEVIKKCSNF